MEQRKAKSRGKLSAERISLLNAIGFSWESHEEDWQNMYDLLKQYFKENGQTEVTSKQGKLGIWVGRQRDSKKKGQLSENRIQLLDEIEFVWALRDQQWQKKYKLLQEYFLCYKNSRVSSKHPELGAWVKEQRQQKIQ